MHVNAYYNIAPADVDVTGLARVVIHTLFLSLSCPSVCSFICQPVCHTGDPRLSGLTYLNALYTARYDCVSSFSGQSLQSKV